MKRHEGFTLIEVMLTVAIMALVFSGLTVTQFSQAEYVKKMESKLDITNIQEALSCYLFFHGNEPEAALDDISIETLFKKGFLIGENKSPWGTPYKLVFRDSSVVVELETPERRR